jgi:hypothetical protein
MIKGKPVIHKIQFTEEEQAEIKAILAGAPTAKQIKRWKERGLTIKKNYNVGSIFGRKKLLQRKFYHGLCVVCKELADNKLIFNIDGAGVVEHYCRRHLPEEHKGDNE